jgi:pimeloyl-ACP methyl ester carboxylesterase
VTTFVLVHGAWGGSYGFRDLARLLRADGHEVYTPSLTGLGERSHLGGPGVNLTTHITDVENVFRYEELSGAVLLGQSYGGMVVTGVADRIPNLIAHLVYTDAFLPRDGQSCFDLGGAGGRQGARIEDGWKVYMRGTEPPAPAPGVQPVFEKRSPQPVGTLEEPVRLSVPLEERAFTRTYVKATGGNPNDLNREGAFWQASARVKDDPRWNYYELPCGHGIPREMPKELKAILYEVIGLQTRSLVG